MSKGKTKMDGDLAQLRRHALEAVQGCTDVLASLDAVTADDVRADPERFMGILRKRVEGERLWATMTAGIAERHGELVQAARLDGMSAVITEATAALDRALSPKPVLPVLVLDRPGKGK
ncbi:hypothetical protein [Azospirillum brasilense]|uniref:hypothetical protein n=1 Tax=Azospirillum brasilense TaxID=192 RepID=UPI000E0C0F80|nr:hypothetical protein [Azospirillum brasilense]